MKLFQDKAIKLKTKVVILEDGLLDGAPSLRSLMAYADQQKAVGKATCLEAIEYATKKNPSIAESDLLIYVAKALRDNEPRVKWESATIVGNIAKVFADQLDQAIANLLTNTRDRGTVVRWAMPYALAEIIRLKQMKTTV